MEMVKDYTEIKECMARRDADVVVSFLLRCNLLVLLAGLLTKQKIIVSDRNNPIKEHSKVAFIIQNIVYHRANRIIVQTKQIKELYWKSLQRKIEVIENPVDTKTLNLQIIDTPKRKNRIISIGRLEKQKDFSTLIRAFTKIFPRFSEWRLDIYGIGDDRTDLEKQIINNNMEDYITLCGRTDKPYKELCESSIFVLSSFYEGFPNVLCEAMYAGDLCIASDCVSGPRELIRQGKNGWLFPVGDVDALASCLGYVIEHIDEMDEVRNNAMLTTERLSVDNIADKWQEIVRRV